MVSDEHNLVYRTSKGNIAKKAVTDVLTQHEKSLNGFYGKFITTFNYNGSGIDLTDEELRVMCAVICDANIMFRKTVDCKCHINIKKERKKKRLEMLLNDANISYVKKQYNPSDPDYQTFIFVPPRNTKTFTSEWYHVTQHQMQIIASEILFWDGCVTKGRKQFSTTVKENADFVQFVFTALGKRCTINVKDRRGQAQDKYIRKSVEYTVIISDSIHPSIINTKRKIQIPKVQSSDGYKYCFTVSSGMLVLRHNGRINITGNSGKSSFISQLVCQCLEQGKNAFVYSGELPNFQTKNWMDYILAGQYNISEYDLPNNNSTDAGDNIKHYIVKSPVLTQIDNYYRNRLFIYKDSLSHSADAILDAMEATARKYGCKLFVIDNLTSVSLGGNKEEKYMKQEEFVTKLITFANKFNVVVLLVVHPHKMDTMRRMTKMDIQGISAIIDLAHRIISLYRVQDRDRQPNKYNDGYSCDVLCDILKDRMRGYEGKQVELYYDVPSRRFFTCEDDLKYSYSWDKEPHDMDLPFGAPQLIKQPF